MKCLSDLRRALKITWPTGYKFKDLAWHSRPISSSLSLPQTFPYDLQAIQPSFSSSVLTLLYPSVSLLTWPFPLTRMNLHCSQPFISLAMLSHNSGPSPRGHHLLHEALLDSVSPRWNMIMPPTCTVFFQSTYNVLYHK